MSEWKFLTETTDVILANHPYWFIGITGNYEQYVDIRRGFMSLEGEFKSDEAYAWHTAGESITNLSDTDFTVVGFMDNPEGLVGRLAPGRTKEIDEKALYLSKEIKRQNYEKRLRKLPSLLEIMKLQQQKEPIRAKSWWDRLID